MGAVTRAANAATSADDALVRRARTGDAAAFGVLVDTRIDRCYRLAWSILSNDADAADATQDALLSAWRQLPRLRDAAAFDGWLNRIVANAALMARRHRLRLREVSVAPDHPGDDAAPARTAAGPRARTAYDDVVDNDAIGARLRPPAAAGPDDPRPPPRGGAAGRRDRAVARDPGRNRQVAAARRPHRAREGDGGRGMNAPRLTDAQVSQALRAHLPDRAQAVCASGSSRRPRRRPSSGRCPRSSVLSATRTRSPAGGACSSPPRCWWHWRSRVPRPSGRCASSSVTPSRT